MSGWRRIETVLRDGTVVILTDGNAVWVGRYSPISDRGDQLINFGAPLGCGFATYWCPLPEPPRRSKP